MNYRNYFMLLCMLHSLIVVALPMAPVNPGPSPEPPPQPETETKFITNAIR